MFLHWLCKGCLLFETENLLCLCISPFNFCILLNVQVSAAGNCCHTG